MKLFLQILGVIFCGWLVNELPSCLSLHPSMVDDGVLYELVHLTKLYVCTRGINI